MIARYSHLAEMPYNDEGLGLRAEVACRCGDVFGLTFRDGKFVCPSCLVGLVQAPVFLVPIHVGRP